MLCSAAKDFDADDGEHGNEGQSGKFKEENAAETEGNTIPKSTREELENSEEADGRVRVRVKLTDKAPSNVESNSEDDDTSHEPAAEEDPTLQSGQPLANRLKDKLEQAGLKTAGLNALHCW